MPARAMIPVALAAALLTACSSPPEGFESPAPSARLRAVSRAAEQGDPSAIPHLIEMLRSDDPLVRLAAIRTLEGLTGQTLGYEHWAPPQERHAAAQRWLDWHSRGPGAVQDPPGTSAAEPMTDIPGGDSP